MTTVIVPLDGSKYAERAVPVGRRLARELDGPVALLSAVPAEEERVERERYLAEVAGADFTSGASWDGEVQASVVVDLDPAGVIHESLRRMGDAVVCMSTHGRGRSAALVGSVAAEVVARGHDPVIMVGPLVDSDLVGSGVMACVDERPESMRLVQLGAHWGHRLDQPVIVTVVAEPVPPPVSDRPVHRLFGPDGDVDAFIEALVQAARDERGDLEIKGEVVWDPISPSDGVVSYVEEHPSALVVVGSRAKRSLEGAVLSHTAAAVVHSSPVPVLVAPVLGWS